MRFLAPCFIHFLRIFLGVAFQRKRHLDTELDRGEPELQKPGIGIVKSGTSFEKFHLNHKVDRKWSKGWIS